MHFNKLAHHAVNLLCHLNFTLRGHLIESAHAVSRKTNGCQIAIAVQSWIEDTFQIVHLCSDGEKVTCCLKV